MYGEEKKCGQGGFTLIEIVIALTIFASMSLFLFTTSSRFGVSKRLLDDRREVDLLSEQIFSRLLAEVGGAHSGTDYRLLGQSGSDPSAALPLSPTFRGIPGQQGGYDRDEVTFILERGGQFLPDQQGRSGPVQVSYRLMEDSEAPSGLSLVRDEVPLISPPEAAFEKRMVFPVTSQIRSLRARYFDQQRQQWSATWGDVPERISSAPSIVELQVTLLNGSGREASFTTAVRLGG
jgi:prepilin-type N-terminal cleavage/methylation domain-containing protein